MNIALCDNHIQLPVVVVLPHNLEALKKTSAVAPAHFAATEKSARVLTIEIKLAQLVRMWD